MYPQSFTSTTTAIDLTEAPDNSGPADPFLVSTMELKPEVRAPEEQVRKAAVAPVVESLLSERKGWSADRSTSSGALMGMLQDANQTNMATATPKGPSKSKSRTPAISPAAGASAGASAGGAKALMKRSWPQVYQMAAEAAVFVGHLLLCTFREVDGKFKIYQGKVVKMADGHTDTAAEKDDKVLQSIFALIEFAEDGTTSWFKVLCHTHTLTRTLLCSCALVHTQSVFMLLLLLLLYSCDTVCTCSTVLAIPYCAVPCTTLYTRHDTHAVVQVVVLPMGVE
jgi:hypothetical protein